MLGRHKVKRSAKSKPKGNPCFHLKSNDHASDCCKIMLSPSGAASYSTNVTWGYRRAPFWRKWTAGSAEATMAVPLALAKEVLLEAQPSNRKRRRVSSCGTSRHSQ